MQTKIWLLIGGASVVIAATVGFFLLQPAHWLVSETTGVDKYEYHRPFWGERVIEHEFTVTSPTLSRLDILVVDFKRTHPTAPLLLTLISADDSRVIRQVSVPGSAVADDYYLPFVFDSIPHTEGVPFRLTLSSPDASSDAPFAVRLTEDKHGLALRTYRSVPQGYLFQQWLSVHRRSVTFFLVTVLLGISASVLIPKTLVHKRYLVILLVLVLVLGTALQILLFPQLDGDTGGDTYYYLYAAHQIADGVNPLKHKTARLPFYPLLLAPAAIPGMPDLEWGKVVGILSTIGLVVSLPLLAVSLRWHPVVGVVAAALLYLSSDFLMTSLRVRPHNVYALLLILSLALLFRITKLRHALGWGIIAGFMAMTRQEAFIPIILMLVTLLFLLRSRHIPWPRIARFLLAAAVPVLVILSPWLYENYRQLGNPLDSQYFYRNDGVQAWNADAFFGDNVPLARARLGTIWLPSSKPGLDPGALTRFLLVLGAVGGWYFVIRTRFFRGDVSPWVLSGMGFLVSLGLAYILFQWLFNHGPDFARQLNWALLSLVLVGLIEFVRVARWRALPVLLILFSQLVIATWYNPIPRLFHHTYPLISLIVAGIVVPQFHRPWWHTSLRVSAFVFGAAVLGAVSLYHLDNAVDSLNYPAASYFVATTAAEQIAAYDGKAAAEVDYSQGDGVYRLHSYQQRLLEPFGEELSLSPLKQLVWLCEHDITYVLDHNDLDYLTVMNDDRYASYFAPLFERRARGWNDKLWLVTAYAFDSETACFSSPPSV